jgi:DnaK suppressor protein
MIAMDEALLNEFRQILLDERKKLVEKAAETLRHEIELSKDDMADESDLASAMTDQHLNLRLRDRERVLIEKIDLAIKRIEDGEFGICAICGDDISLNRLRARPVTTLCIACKEEQERRERLFQG